MPHSLALSFFWQEGGKVLLFDALCGKKYVIDVAAREAARNFNWISGTRTHKMRYDRMAGGLLGTAALMAGGKVNAQITPQGGGYLFRQKFTAGEKINYPMDINSSASGSMPGAGSYKIQMAVHLSVLSVQNGIANVRVTSDGMMMNGKAMQKGESATVKINSRGQTIGGGKGRGAISPIFPQGPVKIGDTFASEGGITSGAGGISTATTFRLVGFKVYNGQKVAQLAIKSNTSGKVAGATTGFMLISMADGQVVSGRTDTNMNLAQGGKGMSLVTHMRIERK